MENQENQTKTAELLPEVTGTIEVVLAKKQLYERMVDILGDFSNKHHLAHAIINAPQDSQLSYIVNAMMGYNNLISFEKGDLVKIKTSAHKTVVIEVTEINLYSSYKLKGRFYVNVNGTIEEHTDLFQIGDATLLNKDNDTPEVHEFYEMQTAFLHQNGLVETLEERLSA